MQIYIIEEEVKLMSRIEQQILICACIPLILVCISRRQEIHSVNILSQIRVRVRHLYISVYLILLIAVADRIIKAELLFFAVTLRHLLWCPV